MICVVWRDVCVQRFCYGSCVNVRLGRREFVLLGLVELPVLGELLRGRQRGVEADLLDPLLLLVLAVRGEEELRAVAGVQPEHELALGVVLGRLHARLEYHQRRTRSLGLEEIFLISEEAHQLATEHSVVRFPGSDGRSLAARLKFLFSVEESINLNRWQILHVVTRDVLDVVVKLGVLLCFCGSILRDSPLLNASISLVGDTLLLASDFPLVTWPPLPAERICSKSSLLNLISWVRLLSFSRRLSLVILASSFFLSPSSLSCSLLRSSSCLAASSLSLRASKFFSIMVIL